MSVSPHFEQPNTEQNQEHSVTKEAHAVLCRQAGATYSFMQVCKGSFWPVNLNCTVSARFSCGGQSRWGWSCQAGKTQRALLC